MKRVTRREFIKASASVVAAYGLTSCDSDTEPFAPAPEGMPTRRLGKTGFNVGLFSLGGQAALETPGQEDLSDEIINRALDLGVNYIDTSAYYGGGSNRPGLSERNIGRATVSRRDSVFLATKTLYRDYDGAMRDLEDSLVRLQTDHIDLWQAHNIRRSAIIGCSSVQDVEENVELACNFTPYSESEMRQLEALTASYYREGSWFKYEW